MDGEMRPAKVLAADMPLMGSMSVASWNCQALFGSDLGRSRRKEAYVRHLASRSSVVMLEEARCGSMQHIGMGEDLALSHICFWDPTPHAAQAGGLGFIVARDFIQVSQCHVG